VKVTNEEERVGERSEHYDREGTRNAVPTKVYALTKFLGAGTEQPDRNKDDIKKEL
jgi:hypothetical protein